MDQVFKIQKNLKMDKLRITSVQNTTTKYCYCGKPTTGSSAYPTQQPKHKTICHTIQRVHFLTHFRNEQNHAY
jgi:hypothetical protein